MSLPLGPIKAVWHWQTMGPYHFARMKALASMPGIDLTVVETTSVDDHGWGRAHSPEKSAGGLEVITLASETFSREVLKQTEHAFVRVLENRRPHLVVVARYAEPSNLSPILRYRHSNPDALCLLWSESTVFDRKRTVVKETLKTLLLPIFDGAVVAGPAHASYLIGLGMPPADIQVAGNCVDNDFFSRRAIDIRRNVNSSESLPADYFLFVGRMIPEKNLSVLIDAYAKYRRQTGASAWSLVLVGSGPEESALRSQVARLGIDQVTFAGMRQTDELPRYYAHAKCFVLPSISEPWGLVVNEAMASGLPILASNRCGCAEDLVRPGVNGFLFDPFDRDSLVDGMRKISGGAGELKEMSRQSLSIVAEYSPALFAQRTSAHFQALYRRSASPRAFDTRRRLRRFFANRLCSLSGLLA